MKFNPMIYLKEMSPPMQSGGFYEIMVGYDGNDEGRTPTVFRALVTDPAKEDGVKVEIVNWSELYWNLTNLPIRDLEWPALDQLYIACGGDVYISHDRGDTPGNSVYSSGSTIGRFVHQHYLNKVIPAMWAYGENNLLIVDTRLTEQFETRIGPPLDDNNITALGFVYQGPVYGLMVAKEHRIYVSVSEGSIDDWRLVGEVDEGMTIYQVVGGMGFEPAFMMSANNSDHDTFYCTSEIVRGEDRLEITRQFGNLEVVVEEGEKPDG